MAPRRLNRAPLRPPGVPGPSDGVLKPPTRAKRKIATPKQPKGTRIQDLLNSDPPPPRLNDSDEPCIDRGVHRANTLPETPTTSRSGRKIHPPKRYSPDPSPSYGRKRQRVQEDVIDEGDEDHDDSSEEEDDSSVYISGEEPALKPTQSTLAKEKSPQKSGEKRPSAGDSKQQHLNSDFEREITLSICIRFANAYVKGEAKAFWKQVSNELKQVLQRDVPTRLDKTVTAWVTAYKRKRIARGTGTGTENVTEYTQRLDAWIRVTEDRKKYLANKQKAARADTLLAEEQRDHILRMFGGTPSGGLLDYSIATTPAMSENTENPLPSSAKTIDLPRGGSVDMVRLFEIEAGSDNTSAESATTSQSALAINGPLAKKPVPPKTTHLRSLEANRNNIAAVVMHLAATTESQGHEQLELQRAQLAQIETIEERKMRLAEDIEKQKQDREDHRHAMSLELQGRQIDLQARQQGELSELRAEQKQINSKLDQMLAGIAALQRQGS